MDVIEAKRRLRAESEARRAAVVATGDAAAAARAAAAHLLATVRLAPGDVVSAYQPIGSELDPQPLLDALVARGVRIVLPAIVERGEPLVFREWRPGLPLKRGPLGIMQPPKGAPEPAPGVVVTPLLAFDRRGGRLGYGAGFYDRTLAALRAVAPVMAIGYAFADQEIEAVPTNPLDQRLDWLATEHGCRPAEPERASSQPRIETPP